MSDAISRLHAALLEAKAGNPATPRTAKLIVNGMPKMAKKLVEEAAEVALDAVLNNREAVILESADLLYNLCAVWVEADIAPADIWQEMERREGIMGIAEKLPKDLIAS